MPVCKPASLGVQPQGRLGQRAGRNPGTLCRSVWFPPSFTWFIYLSSPRPRVASSLLITVTHKFLEAAGEASPWAQAASRSASGCVPGRLRQPLGRPSLPCDVNPTGSPCPVFAGGRGPPCSAAVGAGEDKKHGPSEEAGAPPSPRKPRPRAGRKYRLQVVWQVGCRAGTRILFSKGPLRPGIFPLCSLRVQWLLFSPAVEAAAFNRHFLAQYRGSSSRQGARRARRPNHLDLASGFTHRARLPVGYTEAGSSVHC